MTADISWVDGALSGQIDPRDRGLTLGDGVFDTLVAFRKIPFAGDRHLARIVAHARAIGIIVDPEKIRAGWSAVIEAASAEHLILRTSVTRGIASRGLRPEAAPRPTVIVSATAWSERLLGQQARLITSGIPRNERSPLSRLKSLNYLDNVLAAREASAKGADDALLLNGAGNVACTTIANVFAISGERVVTPPETEGSMPGILRRIVLETARSLGLDPTEATLARADLDRADEVFFTNSVRLIRSVTELDGRAVGGRSPDALNALSASLAERIREECAYSPRAAS